jgi:hypothetical protein
MFKKRKAIAQEFINNTIESVNKFMDKCNNLTGYYILNKDKEYYKSLIEDVVSIFPKEYKRILSVIDNTVDIEWKIIDYLDGSVYDEFVKEAYIYAAEKLSNHFEFIQALINCDDYV